MAKIGVVGASGYAGAELLRIAASHPELDVAVATGTTQAGQPVASLYPNLAADYGDQVFEAWDPMAVDGLDLVFLALPHGESQRLLGELDGRVGRVVDLAADFRLKDPTLYPTWYGEAHTCPERLADFAYGLPELFRPDILVSNLVAAPGCYVTAAALALTPLVRAGLIETTGIVVDAASGVSGAGRPAKPNTTFCAVDEDFSAYGLLTHRHTPEMEQAIGVQLVFTPHLAPMNRGILATCYARPVDTSLTTEDARDVMWGAYAGEPFVVVREDPLSTKATQGSNTAHVSVLVDPRTGWLIACGALDNLVKGAAGQAVQCANLLLGLPEAIGLATVGLYPVSITAARGFVAAGVHCGVKEADLDLALVATASGGAVPAAAVFTANKMTAAPVVTSRSHLETTGGRAAAVVLNSGNANAATGGPGQAHAEQMCAAVAAELGCAADEVLVCSTGLIGIPLPIESIVGGIPALVSSRSPGGGVDAAEAIRTTDSHRKEASVTRGGLTVGGMAKGAAMLAPNMATMLAVLTTDAEVDHATLHGHLRAGVDESFNRLVVDGCMSTNDTVIILASGLAGPPDHPKDLAVAVREVCESLATQMAHDAEGATKVVRVEVHGAASDDDADRGARAIATSQLTKCSWYGCDPYWGRVASDLGSAGIDFDPDRLAVSYGGVTVARGGVAVPHDEEEVVKHMVGRDLWIVADLGLGTGAAHVLTNDLTHAYVDENMGTS